MNIRKAFGEARLMLVGLVVVIWTAIPIYHLFVMSITPQAEAFAGAVWPKSPTLDNYKTVLTQGHYFLGHFWTQLFNSALVAVAVALLTLTVGTCASFAISRLKVRFGETVSNMALLTYLIPAAFLAIPMYTTMG